MESQGCHSSCGGRVSLRASEICFSRSFVPFPFSYINCVTMTVLKSGRCFILVNKKGRVFHWGVAKFNRGKKVSRC